MLKGFYKTYKSIGTMFFHEIDLYHFKDEEKEMYLARWNFSIDEPLKEGLIAIMMVSGKWRSQYYISDEMIEDQEFIKYEMDYNWNVFIKEIAEK